MNRIRTQFVKEVAELTPLLHETYRLLGIFQVRLEGPCLSSKRLELPPGLVLLVPRMAEVNHHIGAGRGAGVGQCPTNAPRRSRHQNELIAKRKVFQAPYFPPRDSIIGVLR